MGPPELRADAGGELLGFVPLVLTLVVVALFLLSLKAGGVGLNLTRASHVFHIDRWWNPAVETFAT